MGGVERWDLDELKMWGRALEADPAEVLNGMRPAAALSQMLLRIRGKDGLPLPLVANAVQAEFERRRGRCNVVLKARQMGLSTWVAGRFFLKTITQPGTLTLEVAHTQEAAEDLFRMVHRFYDMLPENLRVGALRTSRANARALAFPRLDSEYRVETAGDVNAARGLTVQNLHCSEVARWPGDAAEVLAGIRASLTPGGEVVLESTANGAYGCFYNEWMRADETGYVRHFFPWWRDAGYVVSGVALGELGLLSEDERRLVEAEGLSAGQIAYRRKLQKEFGGLARQEFPENADECFFSTGDCVFDADAVDARLRAVPEPVERRWGGALEVWFPPLAGKQYVVGVDPSGGGSDGDYCGMQVIERGTRLQCAEFRGRLSLPEIARRAAELATQYNRALLVVERNNHGHGVLAHLMVAGYEPLFRLNAEEGWLTTGVTRASMVQSLTHWLLEQPEAVNSRRLLHECKTFVRDHRGRAAAKAGEHDDLLMAMGVAIDGSLCHTWKRIG